MYGIGKELYLVEWGELPYVEYENGILLDSLKTLNKNIELSFVDTSKLLKERIRSDSQFKASSDENDLQSDYLDQKYHLDIESVINLKRQQRYAMVLIVFSFFESRLSLIANIISTSELKKKKDKNGLQENDLTVYWNCLLDTHNIHLEECKESFGFINSQKFVRDKIAHKNGIYRIKDEKNDYKFIKTDNSDRTVLGDEFRIEILNESYINSLLLTIEELLNKLLVAIDKKFKN